MDESEKSLEDFFAKKSKKKGAKGKGKAKKFTTSDEIAKKLVEQDTGQTAAPVVASETGPKKPKEVQKQDENTEEEDLNYRFKDDDEWTDFRDDTQKDYSGLKVQALQVGEEQPEGEEEEEEVDENGEIVKNKGQTASGPWNKKQETAQIQPQPVVTPVPEPEPPKEEPKPAGTSSKYVPPNRRSAASNPSATGTSGAALRLGMTRKGKAPQINNEFEFPSLAASSDLVKHSNKVEDATFSTVTRGGQAVDSSASKGGDLALGNRFAALGN